MGIKEFRPPQAWYTVYVGAKFATWFGPRQNMGCCHKGCGSFGELTISVGDSALTALKWFENKPVFLLSSFLTSQPIVRWIRFDKKEKAFIEDPLPNIVYEYIMKWETLIVMTK